MKDADIDDLSGESSAKTAQKKPESEKKIKKIKNTKLATASNPTVVVPENTRRPLIEQFFKREFIKKLQDQLKDVEKGITTRNSRDFDFFQLNLVFNKYLTAADVKLAVYLHEYLRTYEYSRTGEYKVDFKGAVFIVRQTKSNMKIERGYGHIYEDDDVTRGLFIKDKYHSKKPTFYDDEFFFSLISCSENLVGSKSSRVLIKTLQRLHDFGYITVTDITPENQKIPIPGKSGVIRRVRFKHIRLCKWMVFNKLFEYFKDM